MAQQIPSELNIYDGDWCNDTIGDIIQQNCPRTSPWYSSIIFYMPDTNSATKVVRLNLIFVQKDDGTGNFQQGEPEHVQIFDDILSFMNNNLVNMNISSCNGTTVDAKIQFKMNIIYIQDTYLWNNDNDQEPYKCPNRGDWYLKNLAQQIDNDPSIPKGIDIFFTCGETAYIENVINNDTNYQGVNYACSLYPTTNLNDGSYIHMPDNFIKYYWMKNFATIQYNQPWIPIVYNWFVSSTANGLLHELGHSFGLFHEYTCTDHNVMDNAGTSARDFLTDTQISKIHKSLAIYNTRKFVECGYSHFDPLEITQNGLIDFDLKLYRDIFIDSGFTLTVKCKLVMAQGARIGVKPGGSLRIDGGIITNTDGCNQFWQGIEVWGNPDLDQNPNMQGNVTLQNAALIENARFAITTCQSDDQGEINWQTTGGIITADSSTFRNNYKSVQFLSYFQPNKSIFTKTAFETNSDFLDSNSSHSDFVSMYLVNGIEFYGCTFKNLKTPDSLQPENDHGNGIYSINASYTIDDHEYCPVQIEPCPDPIITHSLFSGLHYGVKAINDDPSYFVNILRTEFDSNARAIYIDNSDYSSINLNTFNIPGYNDTGDTLYCLYLNGCTGYSVQENWFKSTYINSSLSAPHSYIGLIVNRSGELDNEIYNNRFDSIPWGIITQDQNRNADGSTGLRIKCNDFTSVYTDITVALSQIQPTWGIAIFQGDSLWITGPAGNTFSPEHESLQLPNSDIDNSGARIKYYHHYQYPGQLPRVKPDFNYNVTVRPTSWTYSKQASCPSKLNEGGPSPEDLTETIIAETDSINMKKSQLIALIDGGNTDLLNSEIISSTPPDALELRDQLLNESPYLSDTAMQTAIAKEDVLPNEMIRDILVSNPQSATSEKVIEELNTRVIPMPDSMMFEILGGEEFISAKEALESELISHKVKRAQVLYDLIRFYKTDTINPTSIDSLIKILQNENELSFKYLLAFEYLRLKNINSLDNILTTIPSSYNFTQLQTEVHNDYLTYFTVMKDLVNNNKNIFTMDSTSISLIHGLYNNGHEPVKSYARNVLITRENLVYHEPILLPVAENLKSSKESKKYKTGKFVENSYMKVFPNPARQYLIVEYNLKEKFNDYNKVAMIVTNIDGNIILNNNLVKRQDQELINTSLLIPGIYFCSLWVNNKLLDRVKFIIIE